MRSRAQTGECGERLAEELLQRAGYTVLARNYHSRFGEIDRIMQNERFLLFVEVKTRAPGGYGTPAQAVDFYKMRRIIKTAGLWLIAHPTQLQPRFDIIEVLLPTEGAAQLNHIENAFDMFGH